MNKIRSKSLHVSRPPRKTERPRNVQAAGPNQTPDVRPTGIVMLGVDHNYNIEKRIGKGTFGEVWLGKSVKNNEDVAIKTVFRKSYILRADAFRCNWTQVKPTKTNILRFSKSTWDLQNWTTFISGLLKGYKTI